MQKFLYTGHQIMNELTDIEIRMLQEALDDEYHAWAIYDQVIADFGEVRPFINIRQAEARHIEALLGLVRALWTARACQSVAGQGRALRESASRLRGECGCRNRQRRNV